MAGVLFKPRTIAWPPANEYIALWSIQAIAIVFILRIGTHGIVSAA